MRINSFEDEDDPFVVDFEDAEKFTRLKKQNFILKISLLIAIILLLLVSISFGIFVYISTFNSTEPTNQNCDSPTQSPTPSPSPSASPSPTTPVSSFYFFQISDIHLDLNYSNDSFPVAQYGQDGGELLLNSTLQAMVDLPGDPAFIFVTGDFVAHNRPNGTVQFETLARASQLVKTYFPDTPVYPAMGNNDVFPDYHFPLSTNTTWMDDLTQLWTDLGWLTADALTTFNSNGYYSIPTLWDGGPKLITLNTLLYSVWLVDSTDPNYYPATPPSLLPDDPNGQFAWLTQELSDARAANQQVILQYHIPPGLNDYDNTANWHDNFTRQFNDVISDYYDIILFHCAAHFHTDEFRLSDGPSGILLNPSISPDHENNPTFRQFVVEDNIVTTFNQYYTDLVRANAAVVNNNTVEFDLEYNLYTAYDVEPVNSPTVEAMIHTLVASTPHYMQYLTQEYAYYPLRRGPAICSMTKQLSLDYFTCIEQYEDDL